MALGVDRILGGTDLVTARRLLGDLSRYFPFPGRPVGHPTRLEGDAALVAEHCAHAMAQGCAGVDLLAYRATQAEPLDLVRAARAALAGGTLIVAGSVNSRARIHALAQAGADAFTVGSSVFDGSFSPQTPRARSPDPRHPRRLRDGAGCGGVSPASGDTLARLLRGEWPRSGRRCADQRPGAVDCDRAKPCRHARRSSSPRSGSDRGSPSSATPTHARCWARASSARLPGWQRSTPVALDGRPDADAATAETVRDACERADAIVAVGSGTINDLCKYAAAMAGKPYAVFATAPSMNGYASKNAAITVDGHKRSLAAASPHGVFMDLAILAAAPPRMIRAGLGDSLCRSTAQADWLLSHHVRGTAYRRAPFALLAEDEPVLFDEPEALLRGDPEAMRRTRAHARPVRARHDDLRRKLSGQPGRAPDQPLHRHVRARRSGNRSCTASRSGSPR